MTGLGDRGLLESEVCGPLLSSLGKQRWILGRPFTSNGFNRSYVHTTQMLNVGDAVKEKLFVCSTPGAGLELINYPENQTWAEIKSLMCN